MYKSIILLCFIFGKLSSSEKSDFYDYNIILERSLELVMKWTVDYTRGTVYFRLQTRLNIGQWLAFGFSDYGELYNADLTVFWVDLFGGNHFQDCWIGHDRIHVDKQQNYILTHAEANRRNVLLEFHRKFDTCDCKDYKFDTGTTHIIYFVGSGPLINVEDIRLSDVTPGLQRVQLLKPKLPVISYPTDTKTFEIRAPNVLIPDVETTYWWFTTELPQMSEKHHIIRYEGIIQNNDQNLVHHIELFHCEVAMQDTIPFYNGPGSAEGKPPKLQSCRKVIGAWALGAQAMVLPKEAGTPVGGKHLSRFVLLEVHYNNPDLKKGVVDSSGIRFYVTKKLRKYDSGIMELGLEYTNKMAIPPGQKDFHLTGYCIPHCTHTALPPDGIKVYASQLHTHLTGKRVYTKHARKGVELPELNRDNHYSPHFQEIRLLPEKVHVLPGDELITTCEYNTVRRRNATIGGFSIHEEMCVNYIHYYPSVNLEVCKSSVSTRALQTFFKFMHRWNENVSPENGDKQNYEAINWTYSSTDVLKKFYQQFPLSMQCNQSDGTRFPGHWEDQPIPVIPTPLPKTLEERSCGHRC